MNTFIPIVLIICTFIVSYILIVRKLRMSDDADVEEKENENKHK